MGKLIPASVLLIAVVIYLLAFSGDRFDPGFVRDKRVLVTGASAGIGEQLAYEYARLGARLVITARSKDLLQNVSRTCLKLGAKQADFVPADMADPKARDRVIEFTKKHLGGLDDLILNHALQYNVWWLEGDHNLTMTEHIFRVNFFANVDLASKTLPMLVASRGRIGVVSSILGILGAPLATSYSASKFALHGFFSSLRQELRIKDTGVSVTFAVLGPVSTDTLVNIAEQRGYKHIPAGFVSTPEQAAKAILENVQIRCFSFVFDWKFRVLMVVQNLLPEFYEDFFSDVMLNNEKSWLAQIMLFLIQSLW